MNIIMKSLLHNNFSSLSQSKRHMVHVTADKHFFMNNFIFHVIRPCIIKCSYLANVGICVAFVQLRPNVFDAGQTLWRCCADVVLSEYKLTKPVLIVFAISLAIIYC